MKSVLWLLFTIASSMALAIWLSPFIPIAWKTHAGLVLWGYIMICTIIGLRWEGPWDHHHDH